MDPSSPPRLPVLLFALLASLLPGLWLAPARAEGGIGGIVRAFCLSAFDNEMSQAGKTPPKGMADFACGCVADRMVDGSSLDTARQTCRVLTARRYPL
ncbi:MAG: hypothetical protein WCF98_05380 [Synechococcus sp. ELA057]|jgi:hypothetical protein